MNISRLGGVTILNDTTQYKADSIDCIFTAFATISVGSTAAFALGDTTGTRVAPHVANATADHLVVGIYTGEAYAATTARTGPNTTISGMKGVDALSGNIIMVRTYGVATALVDGTTTDAADGNVLVPSLAVAGELQSAGTTSDTGDHPMFTVLEANTGATAAKKVFCRCM